MEQEKYPVIVNVSKSYNDKTILRMAVNAIPYIGGALDLLLSSKWNKIAEKRIEDFFEFVNEKIDTVEEEKINKDFLETEEFADILMECLRSSMKTRERNKIKNFSNILSHSITFQDFDVNNFEEIKTILETLSLREVQVLVAIEEYGINLKKFYYQYLEKAEAKGGFWSYFLYDLSNKMLLNIDDLKLIIDGLMYKGLVIESNYDAAGNYNARSGRNSFDHRQKYETSKLYLKLKNFIVFE